LLEALVALDCARGSRYRRAFANGPRTPVKRWPR